MRKTVIVKIYAEDRDILKEMKGSIAQAINTLIHGKKEEVLNVIEGWGIEYINPKIEQIRKTLSEEVALEIERRFKELGTK